MLPLAQQDAPSLCVTWTINTWLYPRLNIIILFPVVHFADSLALASIQPVIRPHFQWITHNSHKLGPPPNIQQAYPYAQNSTTMFDCLRRSIIEKSAIQAKRIMLMSFSHTQLVWNDNSRLRGPLSICQHLLYTIQSQISGWLFHK